MATPTVDIPLAVVAVVVSVVLSIPANFVTSLAQRRWVRGRERRWDEIQWHEDLMGLVSRLSDTVELHKRSLVPHDTLIPDDRHISKELEVAFAKQKEVMDDEVDEEILDHLEDVLTSEDALALHRADHQRSAIETIEKINQRKMSDMATLHDELLRHVSSEEIDPNSPLGESLRALLRQTYIQSIFPEITDANYEKLMNNCEKAIEASEERIANLEFSLFPIL